MGPMFLPSVLRNIHIPSPCDAIGQQDVLSVRSVLYSELYTVVELSM